MLITKNLFKSNGFTFTELLISLALSSLLLTGLITFFAAEVNHHQRTVNTNRLNEELASTLQMMSTEISRAGYWSNTINDIGTGQNNNPFMTSTTDISVNGSNNCILFTYDHNKDGALPGISASYDDERYGYRLINQVIQARPPGATFSCTASSTAWEDVTDTKKIIITNLTFTLTQKTIVTGPGTTALTMRSVDITLTGSLPSDPTITKTLSQHIRIQNDKFIP